MSRMPSSPLITISRLAFNGLEWPRVGLRVIKYRVNPYFDELGRLAPTASGDPPADKAGQAGHHPREGQWGPPCTPAFSGARPSTRP